MSACARAYTTPYGVSIGLYTRRDRGRQVCACDAQSTNARAGEQFANCTNRDVAERSQPCAELRPSVRKKARTKNTRSSRTPSTMCFRLGFLSFCFICLSSLLHTMRIHTATYHIRYICMYNVCVRTCGEPPPRRRRRVPDSHQ